MGNNKRNRNGAGWRQGLVVGAWTFLVAVFISWPAQGTVERQSLFIALPLLLIIILTGVLFDMIGVAVAVADEAPFNALSAKKIPGSRQARALIQNADRVSSFCNDIVGDLCGTISGAAGAAIVYRVSAGAGLAGWTESLTGLLSVGLIAALTVGGKAAGKGLAMRRANSIVQRVGRVLHWVESATGLALFPDGTRKPARKRVKAVEQAARRDKRTGGS